MEEKSCRLESLKRVRATCREFAAEDVKNLSGGELGDESLLQKGGQIPYTQVLTGVTPKSLLLLSASNAM